MDQGRRISVAAAAVILVCAFVFVVYREFRIERPEQIRITTSGRVDMCLSCHDKEKLDPAHDGEVIGCAPCHLGNPLAIEKEKAHQGMILNPGDLEVVHKTCGD